MVKRGRPPKELKFDDLPKELRYPIIKMMAQYKIKDFSQAYDMAGMLLDRNSEEFTKAVQNEAESKYRRRHFTVLNKARNTIFQNGYNSGYRDGHSKGMLEHRIWYYCNICGKAIVIAQNDNSHEAMIKLMSANGWAHSACRK